MAVKPVPFKKSRFRKVTMSPVLLVPEGDHGIYARGLVLRQNKSSLLRRLRRSHWASIASRQRNSASHSCLQSARKRRGTMTP